MNSIQLQSRLTQFSGNYQMTYVSIGTAFWEQSNMIGNQRAFELFNTYKVPAYPSPTRPSPSAKSPV